MNKPRLYIPRKVHQKIMHFVTECDSEVSGMGLCSYDQAKNYFWVRDVYLLDQEVGSAHTDIDAESLGKLEYECLRDKREGDLNFWWHSHVNMGVFWSGQDTQTINSIGKNGYCLATVFNKRSEMRSAVAFSTQFGNIFLDELETIIYDAPPSKTDIEVWNSELSTKVRKPKYNSLYSPKQFDFESDWPYKYSRSDKWTTPTEDEAIKRAKTWAKSCPEVLADVHTFLACVSTKLHPRKFDTESLYFSQAQWTKLDEHVTEFITKHPNFNVQEYLYAANN